MTKVAILSSVHPAFDHRIFYKEAKSLVKAGFNVTLIVPHTHNEVVCGIRLIAIDFPASRFERMTKTVWQLFRQARLADADIYHFHDPELLGVGLLLKLKGKKVIYDSHEDVPGDIMLKDYIPLFPRWLISQAAKVVEKGVSRFFDGVIVAADQMLPGFRNMKRLVSVRNYPLLDTYFPAAVSPKSDITRFIYIGNVSEIRGISQVVRAIGMVPEHIPCKFLLYGPLSPDSYLEQLKRENGFERTEYRGVLDFANVPSTLREADVGIALLQPTETYTAGLPTKLFEYMASGLPVITSKFDCYDEFLGKHKCGMSVDPTNAEAIAEALIQFATDPALRTEMGTRGRVASNLFSWQNESKKMLELYEQVTGAW
jgi:glycosyltransferase involved in cell wall biosynthesis